MKGFALTAIVVLAASCATTRPTAPAPKPIAHARQKAAPKAAAKAATAAPTEAEPDRPKEPTPPGADEDDTPAETGLASYYADNLAGSRTASGERYRPDEATCAHRSYPFGTLIDVTVTGSGLTATCRVNDRGPWADGRVVDVSKKVARELGMIGPGVLEVSVRKHED